MDLFGKRKYREGVSKRGLEKTISTLQFSTAFSIPKSEESGAPRLILKKEKDGERNMNPLKKGGRIKERGKKVERKSGGGLETSPTDQKKES